MLEKHGVTASHVRVSSGVLVPERRNGFQKAWVVAQCILFGTVVAQFILMYRGYHFDVTTVSPCAEERHSRPSHASKDIPDYYQTSPEIMPGRLSIALL